MMRAFSLIETVIVIAISTVMMLTLGFVIYQLNGSVAYEQTVAQSSGSASAIMREINSLTVPADAVLGAHIFPSATYTSSATALVLEIPSIDPSGNIIANTYDYAAFYTVGTNAYRLLAANTASKRSSGTKQLSSTVMSFTFAYNNTDFTKVSMVTTDVQTQAHVKQNTLSDHRSEQVWLRNF